MAPYKETKMTKYKRTITDDELQDEIDELEAQNRGQPLNEQEPDDEVDVEKPQKTSNDSSDKRYNDLRSYSQRKLNEKDAEIEALSERLSELEAQKTSRPPVDEKELEEWMNEYPVVSKMIKTLARKEVDGLDEKLKEKLKKSDELDSKIHSQEERRKLAVLQPDFYDTILPSEEFQEWVKEKAPKWAVDAMKSAKPNADTASDAIDLFKLRTGWGAEKKKETEEFDERSAAQAARNTKSSKPKSKKGSKFSESQVARMSSQEYDANEQAIEEAIRSGEFEYDLTVD